jgi:hypothetical protein
MTLGGWLIMLTSVGAVTTLFAWCVTKVLTTPGETKKLHGTDRPTPDEEE